MVTSKLNEQIISEVIGAMPGDLASRIKQELDLLTENPPARGLDRGTQAPSFSLPDEDSNQVSLPDLLAKGPVVVSFFRGNWCPICVLEIQALQEILPHIKSLGGNIIGISPQEPKFSRMIKERFKVDFPLLSDTAQEVISAYDVKFTWPTGLHEIYLKEIELDISEQNADGSMDLPVPAIYILNSGGEIYERFFSLNFIKRMEPADILSAFTKLAS